MTAGIQTEEAKRAIGAQWLFAFLPGLRMSGGARILAGTVSLVNGYIGDIAARKGV